jgi:hypothetical protein
LASFRKAAAAGSPIAENIFIERPETALNVLFQKVLSSFRRNVGRLRNKAIVIARKGRGHAPDFNNWVN